jgi:signal transduction histidine kinase
VIKTLRTRLTVLHVAVLVLTLALFAVLSYQGLSRTLYRHHDDELAEQAADLAERLEDKPLTAEAIRQSFAGSTVGSRFLMVRDSSGELLYRDPILESLEPALGQHAALIHAASMGSTTPEFFTVTLPRSGDVRFICVPLADAAAYVQIGDPLGDVRATLHAIAEAWLPLIPVVLLLASAGGWLLARRALRPMERISATLAQVQATDLSRRVDVSSSDEEVAELTSTLNRLLDRLQRSFDGLRQFAGDVSHQIKTPLTVIKGSLEGAARRPDRHLDDAFLQQMSVEVAAISDTVEDLQAFALADEPVAATNRVDLSQVVEEAADIIGALGELRQVSVKTSIERRVLTHGDAGRLKQVVLNLGDNAVKYTPAGGRVSIGLRAGPASAILEISDTGIGIAAEHLPRIFDRLFRADAVARSGQGAGLGLAIAKRIIEAHGGQIVVESSLGQGATFLVTLPRRDTPEG